MSSSRPVLTTLAMVLVTGLIVAMLAVLWMVGQDLLRLKDARAEVSARLTAMEQSTSEVAKLRAELKEARTAWDGLSAGLRKTEEGLQELKADLADLKPRLKAVEEARRPRLGVGLAPPRHEPPMGPLPPAGLPDPADLARWLERAREDPALLPVAARRAFQEKGIAGLGLALGLDAAGQAAFQKAYQEFHPALFAAEKAHAKVAIEGDTVRIDIAPYPEQGAALRKQWEKTLAQVLPPQAAERYAKAQADALLFEHSFGDYAQSVTLATDAMGIKYTHKGRRAGLGVATFDSAGTVSGEGALNRLRWRHILTEEAAAKLRRAAQEPF